MRASEAGLFFGERRFDFFSGENERDKDGLAASAVVTRRIGGKTSESVAAVDELFDGEEQALILRHGQERKRDCRQVGTVWRLYPPLIHGACPLFSFLPKFSFCA